jgi:hypothetical protein
MVVPCKLHHYRVSAVEEKRRSVLRNRLAPAGYLAVDKTRDYAGSGLIVDLLTNDGTHRNYTIRGIPDGWISYDQAGDERLGVPNELRTYLDYIVAGGFALRGLVQMADTPGLPTITAIQKVANTLVLTVAGLTVSPQDVVLVSNVKGYKVQGIAGQWTVLSYAGSDLTVKSGRAVDSGFQLDVPPTLRIIRHDGVVAKAMEDIIDWDNVRAGTRRVGRPTDSHRGRR